MNKKALNLAVLASLVMVGSVDHGRVDGVTNGHINAIIGDCGYEKYDVAESGAAGYCYVSKAFSTVEKVTIGSEPVFVAPAVVRTSVQIPLNDTENASDENPAESPMITPLPVVSCNSGCDKVDDGSVPGTNDKSNDPEWSDKPEPVQDNPCYVAPPSDETTK